MEARAQQPFGPEVNRLLEARQISLRRLAALTGVSAGHLSRVLRGVDQKGLTAEVRGRVAGALGLPAGYFIEEREEVAVTLIKSDPAVRDRVYEEAAARGARQ